MRILDCKRTWVTFGLLYGNSALILVDNLHFQYNSMMYGLMLLSLVAIFERKVMLSAFYFAVLLQFKHIYLYSAPAFGMFYLTFALRSPTPMRSLA